MWVLYWQRYDMLKSAFLPNMAFPNVSFLNHFWTLGIVSLKALRFIALLFGYMGFSGYCIVFCKSQTQCVNVFLLDSCKKKQCVSVDGNFSQFKPGVSGVPQGSVYTTDMWNDLENKIISYADTTTFYVEDASPSNCLSLANYLNMVFYVGNETSSL